jgi:hypothetical protein
MGCPLQAALRDEAAIHEQKSGDFSGDGPSKFRAWNLTTG